MWRTDGNGRLVAGAFWVIGIPDKQHGSAESDDDVPTQCSPDSNMTPDDHTQLEGTVAELRSKVEGLAERTDMLERSRHSDLGFS
jgi:hypothetical protein